MKVETKMNKTPLIRNKMIKEGSLSCQIQLLRKQLHLLCGKKGEQLLSLSLKQVVEFRMLKLHHLFFRINKAKTLISL